MTTTTGQATLSQGDSPCRASGLLEPAAAADSVAFAALAAEPPAVRCRVTHVEKPTFEVEAHFELKDRRVVALGQSVAASFTSACACERSKGPAS